MWTLDIFDEPHKGEILQISSYKDKKRDKISYYIQYIGNRNERKVFSRCENHAKNMNCEDMDTCPAYKLYLMAKKKRKVSYKQSDWGIPPTPRPEMI